ncbi:MAG: Gfo/Idh/MocA family oxidoreductase, partial [Kiritimatiellae bacterium]|nr:Gfo/Idh/MocA family oxidoreductase [Kiritimatiellia bacterium]
MNTNRREFLKGTAWMGAAAIMAGCDSKAMKLSVGGSMQGYAAPALKKVRVGFVGLGMRGPGAVHRIAAIPGAEVAALCDIYPERVAAQQQWLEANGKPKALEFTGPEGYKAMCESDAIDVVYNATSWNMHVPIALYAMEHGKHAMVEVPSAFTVEDCWAL